MGEEQRYCQRQLILIGTGVRLARKPARHFLEELPHRRQLIHQEIKQKFTATLPRRTTWLANSRHQIEIKMPYRESSDEDSSELDNISDEEVNYLKLFWHCMHSEFQIFCKRYISRCLQLPPYSQELAAFMEIQNKKKRSKGPAKDVDDDEEEEQEEEEEAIYNTEVMHDKLEDLAWTGDQPWEETLAITSAAPTSIENIDDDLERELAFYNQAADAAKQAIQRFEAAGVAWRRPADYYAEMVKSDDHMAKVKEQLMYEQKVIETSQQRRKEREAKRFARQVSAERKKERAQEKKAAITGVAALRKQRKRDGFAGELDVDTELEKLDTRKPKGVLGERFKAKGTSAKRAQRDSKFGFGGPKRKSKMNDAYSAAGGEYKQGRASDGGRGGGKGTRGGKVKRLGKTRRAAMKRK